MARRSTRWAAYGLAAALGLAPGWAAGDVIPPDVDACRSQQVGAACGGAMGVPAGRCQQDTCSRIDYAGWNRDAMAAPPSMQYACVRCVAGASDAGSNDGGAADGGAAPSSSGGCSVVTTPAGRRFGPWLLAGLVGAAFLVRRRREG